MTDDVLAAPTSARRGRRPLHLGLLVNPSSGGGRGAAVGRRTGDRLRELGHQVQVLTAADAAGARALVRAATAVRGDDALDALVVIGGDGAVHLGVDAVAGTSLPLGVIPAGTGNDVARCLGLPLDAVSAVDTLDACLRLGLRHDVDAIRVRRPGTGGDPAADGGPASSWVAGVVAAGFDAVVNERANGMRWPRGRSRYNLAIVRELPTFRPVPYRLVLDGVPWETEALLVAVANTATYGGAMRIAPDASPSDGLLDVVVVGPVGLARFARLFPKVYAGTHVDIDAVQVRRARTVEVSVDPDGARPRPIVAYGDGERLGPVPLTLSAEPGALSVLVPTSP